MTPAEIFAATQNLATDIFSAFTAFQKDHANTNTLALIGIRTGGDELMRRIVNELNQKIPNQTQGGSPLEIFQGTLDITLYRDDAHQTLELDAPLLRATNVDFSIEGIFTVLVDDVLYTGRTVRAALEALNDFGRPACVQLAVLVDRGGHQLPISADFVGKTFAVKPSHQVEVVLSKSIDDTDKVIVFPR